MMMKFHPDKTLPKSDEVFVFGSNLAGVHGAGAAKVAHSLYNAVYGIGIGRVNQSYAIPTKDANIETLSLDIIKLYVDDFIKYSNENSYTNFFITRIGCGLAGYKDYQIAPMFIGCGINCDFPIEWKMYLQNPILR